VTVAPVTVKLFAATPVRVKPALGVRAIVAVYTVLAAKLLVTAGVHVTVPVYWAVSVMAVTGVCPRTGALTPGIAKMLMVVSEAAFTVKIKFCTAEEPMALDAVKVRL
jgi:hypothetical protein